MQRSTIIISILLAVVLGLAIMNYFSIKMLHQQIAMSKDEITKLSEAYSATLDSHEESHEEDFEAQIEALKIKPGTKAPNFSLPDPQRNIVSLNEFSEKPILLIFSSATCSVCGDFYPEVNKYVNQYQDVDVLVLQMDASPEQNSKSGYDFRLLAATDDIFEAYGVFSTPTSILLNSKHEVMKTGDLFDYEDIVAFTQ